ncbi:MAG: 5-formyltetrahydrofolate cyclo-ligase [Bacteroidales bacterium]|nr:5-formyltetrahydrofolate cyclo-ligase [Bacteroidales bacterium]
MDKKSLRQQIRQLKKEHSAEELAAQSVKIMAKLAQHPDFLQAKRVMLYASLPDEVQTLDFLSEWKTRKQIILPTVVGDDIIPVELTDNCNMVEGDFHIWEPENHPYTGGLDLIVVPGMAFDEQGHRLGRGKGYYDRFLIKYPDVKTIGICFDFQLLEEIPTEPHDRIISEILSL